MKNPFNKRNNISLSEVLAQNVPDENISHGISRQVRVLATVLSDWFYALLQEANWKTDYFLFQILLSLEKGEYCYEFIS